jgi:NADPH:quinone reductase-like Zn-dependent oxidoreductase
MKAIIYKDYGTSDVLQLTDRPTPEPARDEVLIRIKAAGLNPIDTRIRGGEMKFLLPGGFPRIPGYDVAGVIEDVGSEATYFKKGQRVMAFLDHIYGGGYAEYATCSTSAVIPIPDEMKFSEAAALPLAGSTALQCLRDFARLKEGDRVLISGASGGVGHLGVQIACAMGGIVTGVASEPNRDFVLSLGAVGFIDYKTEDYTTLDRHWNIIFDAAGKTTYTKARKALTNEGQFVSTEPNFRGLIVSMLTWPLSQQSHVMLARSRASDLEALIHLWSQGKLHPHVGKEFELADAARAHEYADGGGFQGKIVLIVE